MLRYFSAEPKSSHNFCSSQPVTHSGVLLKMEVGIRNGAWRRARRYPVYLWSLRWVYAVKKTRRLVYGVYPRIPPNTPLVTHTHAHPFNGPFPGLPGLASTRKVKPIRISLEQETVSGSGISWAICKSASRSRQITMPLPHHSFFTGQMPFLPPNQQRQSTEGSKPAS